MADFDSGPGSKLDFEPQPDGTLLVRVLTRGAGIAEAIAVRAKRAKA